MSVSSDAVSTQITNGSATITWTHTPVGTPSGVGVFFGWVDVGSQTISSVTYGGASCSQIGSTQTGGLFWKTAIFGLANPSSGAQTVVITFSSALSHGCSAYAQTVTGGDTTTVFSNSAGTSGTIQNLSNAVTSASGELVSDILSASSSTVDSYGQTQINQGGLGGGGTGPTSGSVFGSSIASSGASVTMTETLNGAVSVAWSGASFKVSGGGGGGFIASSAYQNGQVVGAGVF